MNRKTRNLYAAVGLALGGLVLMFVLTETVGNLWHRLALFYVLMIPAALLGVKLEWKKLFRFNWKHAGVGVVAAVALWALGWVGSLVLHELWPDFAGEVDAAYAMLADVPAWQAWPLLVWIIAGEEIVWRLGATLPCTDKWKAWGVACGAGAFALVHIPWGGALLLIAALVFGAGWSALAWKSKSFWAPFVAHLGWDVLVLFVATY